MDGCRCFHRYVRIGSNALHHGGKTVRALWRQVILESHLIEGRFGVDIENVIGSPVGIDCEKNRNQTPDYMCIALAEKFEPGWLIVTCNKSGDEILQQEDYASCACAIQNLMLYLSEAGVATKWTTGPITRDKRFYRLLEIDPNEVLVVGIVWYGYPKITPEQKRKDVADIVTEMD